MSAVPVRDLFLAQDTRRLAHEGQAAEVLSAWALAWIPCDAAWSPRLESACVSEAALDCGDISGWAAHGKAGAASVHAWAGAQTDVVQRLAFLMTGREGTVPLPDDDWAVHTASAALSDLHARLLGPAMAVADAGSPDMRRLSGTVVVRERALGLAWAWAPQAALLAVGKAASAPLAAVTQGIASQPVRIAVGLGEVEIDVADLLGLQIGDVIRFPATLKGPVSIAVITPGQPRPRPVLDARLGQRDGHVAVQLQSPHAAS